MEDNEVPTKYKFQNLSVEDLRLPKRRRFPASHNKLKISSTFLSLSETPILWRARTSPRRLSYRTYNAPMSCKSTSLSSLITVCISLSLSRAKTLNHSQYDTVYSFNLNSICFLLIPQVDYTRWNEGSRFLKASAPRPPIPSLFPS